MTNRNHIESVLYWMSQYKSQHYLCVKDKVQKDKYYIYSLIWLSNENPTQVLRWTFPFKEAVDKMTELVAPPIA